jgi:hypothetical protein
MPVEAGPLSRALEAQPALSAGQRDKRRYSLLRGTTVPDPAAQQQESVAVVDARFQQQFQAPTGRRQDCPHTIAVLVGEPLWPLRHIPGESGGLDV